MLTPRGTRLQTRMLHDFAMFRRQLLSTNGEKLNLLNRATIHTYFRISHRLQAGLPARYFDQRTERSLLLGHAITFCSLLDVQLSNVVRFVLGCPCNVCKATLDQNSLVLVLCVPLSSPIAPWPSSLATTSSCQLCEVHLSCNDLCACAAPFCFLDRVRCLSFAQNLQDFLCLVGIFNSVDRCSDCLFFWADPCSSVGLESIFGMLAHAGVCWCKIPP